MLHVLKHKRLSLVEDQEFNAGQKILVDRTFEIVCFVVHLVSGKHPDCEGRCHYDVALVELFVKF
jgi:hypothetical protein